MMDPDGNRAATAAVVNEGSLLSSIAVKINEEAIWQMNLSELEPGPYLEHQGCCNTRGHRQCHGLGDLERSAEGSELEVFLLWLMNLRPMCAAGYCRRGSQAGPSTGDIARRQYSLFCYEG